MEILSEEFNQRALIGGSIIGFINGYFGAYIVLRKEALFAGTIAHALLPGIAIAILFFGITPLSPFIGALFAALIIGVGATGISRQSRLDKDSALAVLYTGAFATGLLILNRVKANIELENYLFGYILFLSDTDLWMVFGVGVLVMVLLIVFQRPLLLMLFEPHIAKSQGVPVQRLYYMLVCLLILTLITTFQAVGCILTLGLLVGPASIVYLWCDNPRLYFWFSSFIGFCVPTCAIIISNLANVQTGALIVSILAGIFLISFFMSPRYGLLRHLIARHSSQHEH